MRVVLAFLEFLEGKHGIHAHPFNYTLLLKHPLGALHPSLRSLAAARLLGQQLTGPGPRGLGGRTRVGRAWPGGAPGSLPSWDPSLSLGEVSGIEPLSASGLCPVDAAPRLSARVNWKPMGVGWGWVRWAPHPVPGLRSTPSALSLEGLLCSSGEGVDGLASVPSHLVLLHPPPRSLRGHDRD